MLLQRNNKQGIDVVVIQREVDEGTNDPLSPHFIVPQWLQEKPTPWNIVCYFNLCLEELILDGQERSLIGDYKRELRPAKQLLEYGLEVAARSCRLTAQETFGPVSMYRVLDRVEKIRELRHTTD